MTISANTAKSRTISSALFIFAPPAVKLGATLEPAVAGCIDKLE
jgi:hypothetical protein